MPRLFEDYQNAQQQNDAEFEKVEKRRRRTEQARLGVQQEDEKIVRMTASEALKKHSRSVLNRHVSNNPKVLELKQQEAIIKQKIKEYEALKDDEWVAKCKEELNIITGNKDKLTNVMKNNLRTKEEREEIDKKVRNNKTIKEANKKISDIKLELKLHTPKGLTDYLTEVRNRLKIVYSDDIDSEENDEVVYNIDELLKNKNIDKELTIKEKYKDILERIAGFTNISVASLRKMTNNEIRKALNQSFKDIDLDDKISELKDELTTNEVLRSMEYQEIYGKSNLETLFLAQPKYFDLDKGGMRAKEVICAQFAPKVQNYAYNLCTKANRFDNYDDIVGYGLLYLTIAVNKWLELQMQTGSPVAFEPIFNSLVYLSMMRESMGYNFGGMITGTNIATKKSKFKTEIDALVMELEGKMPDVPKEIIHEIAVRDIEATGKYIIPTVSTETEYTATVGKGASEGDTDEVWSNTNVDEVSKREIDEAEARNEYEKLISALQELFSLFKQKTDKKTGQIVNTGVALFDTEDRMIFLMAMGIKMKEMPDGSFTPYDQTEIAQKIVEYRKGKGINSTMTQAAISSRLTAINKKIADVMKTNNKLATAFKYIQENWLANKVVMERVSSEYKDAFDKIVEPNQKKNDNK